MRLARLVVPATLSLALLAAPLAARRSSRGRSTASGSSRRSRPPGCPPVGDAFLDGLREQGYVEGQNLTIERRFSEGKADRLPALVADLLRLDVQLIVASRLVRALRQRMPPRPSPSCSWRVADPIGMGLVASLARPGGNVTGLATIDWEAFTAKQLKSSRRPCPVPRASRSS